MQAIVDSIKAFAAWLWGLAKAAVLTVFDMLKDVFFWIIDTVLGFVMVLLGSLDFSAFNPAAYIAAIPADITNVLGLIGLGEATAIIVFAIGIRIVLQLIPFTRLGS